MADELACHLVDLTVLRTTASLTLGYLQAYAEADPRVGSHYRFSTQCRLLDGGVEPVWRDIESLIEKREAKRYVFGFTNFFWNRSANLTLARRIKQRQPEALVVFGGNDVTDQSQALIADDSPVDVVVNGEGEIVFANLLARYREAGADLRPVNGISFRDGGNGAVTTPPQPRLDELDTIPSPFLCGLFPRESIAHSIDIAYEFSRGCPFKCAFCYWGAAIGTKTRRFSLERIRQDLDFIISHAGPVARIWMADANFGMTDADVEIAYLLADLVQRKRKRILLMTNWAKNTTKRVIEAATILYRHDIITGVTLSAQSLNDEVLKIADRKNIPFAYYRQLQEKFEELGIPTYTELIFGMPGESYPSFLEGVANVIDAGGTPVIHPLILLNNTEYNKPYMRERHGIRSRLMRFMGQGVCDADILIAHDRLSYAEWLRGMGLRIAVPVFYCGILKFVIRRLHAVYRLDYGAMLDTLVQYCMEGRVTSLPIFGQIFLHYMASSHSPDDAPPAPAGIKENQFGHAHYLGLMKCVLRDAQMAGRLIGELSDLLGRGIADARRVEFAGLVEYQKLLVFAMSQVSRRNSDPIQTNLTSAELSELAGMDIAQDHGSFRLLTVRADYRFFTPDDFVFRIFLGGIDTTCMFAPAQPAPERAEAVSTRESGRA